MTHKVIAIDGPAASGKGSLARSLAANLGYAYLDTGALYRAVGHAVLLGGGDPDDARTAIGTAQSLAIAPEDLQSAALRSDEAGQAASKVAKFAGVREALLSFQKNFAASPPAGFTGVILDGRDIGTVICPDADVKLFITANVEERSKRRFEELQARGINTAYDAVLADMIERDTRDSGREAAPLIAAPDAHIIDTSAMLPDEVVACALEIIVKQTG
ncbi:MAG: (d)CMP kinase [Micavibrio sp.]